MMVNVDKHHGSLYDHILPKIDAVIDSSYRIIIGFPFTSLNTLQDIHMIVLEHCEHGWLLDIH